jgi:hypothetical protein
MSEEKNPYEAPKEKSQLPSETSGELRSFHPSDRSWNDMLKLLGIGLVVAVPAGLVLRLLLRR